MTRIVLISGASRGIGFAMAKKFAQDKDTTVIMTARRLEALEKASKKIQEETKNPNIFYFQCNFTNMSEIQQLATEVEKRWKKVDVLINNVALSLHFGATLETPESKFDKMIVGNIKSYFYTTQFFLKLIPKEPTSSIIFISSYAGYQPNPTVGVYSMTKAAINSLTTIISKELQDTKIRVNCIAPGLIKTDFSQTLWESNMLGIPIGQSEDIANVVYFVCSDAGQFINGAVIPVTGQPTASL